MLHYNYDHIIYARIVYREEHLTYIYEYVSVSEEQTNEKKIINFSTFYKQNYAYTQFQYQY